MGNRAVIQFGDAKDAMGIYLHWNGGEESVRAFLEAGRVYEIRYSEDYGVARLAQIIGNFFGGSLSVGVGLARKLDQDNGDNGTYIIDDEGHIKGRKFKPEREEPFNEEKYQGVLDEVLKLNDPMFKRPAGA
jgi:hypothetical protein